MLDRVVADLLRGAAFAQGFLSSCGHSAVDEKRPRVSTPDFWRRDADQSSSPNGEKDSLARGDPDLDATKEGVTFVWLK